MKQVPITGISKSLGAVAPGEQLIVTRRGKPVAMTVMLQNKTTSKAKTQKAFARLRRMIDESPTCSYARGITAEIRRDRDRDRL